MRLIFIRHGQTIDNVRGALGTDVPGPGLTELGFAQAAAIPAALEAVPIDAIYISTMTRTRLTAEPLAAARGLELRVIDGIQEITAGDLEQHTDPESRRVYMTAIFTWWNDFSAHSPGGEDGHAFYSRFTKAVAHIAAENSGGTAVVFSHGAAMRAWLSYTATNIDAEYSRSAELDNTAMVVLDGSPDEGWVAVSWAGEPVGGPELDDPTAADPIGAGA